jgi:hypothetical protein
MRCANAKRLCAVEAVAKRVGFMRSEDDHFRRPGSERRFQSTQPDYSRSSPFCHLAQRRTKGLPDYA